jgi:hypothetical protein
MAERERRPRHEQPAEPKARPSRSRPERAAVLFDWLAEAVSFRGIADSVAYGYIQQHGSARWQDIAVRFASRPSCPKLTSYWHFDGCGYRKAAHRCAEPSHLSGCPLPTHDLRNGGLNQTNYSLFLFIRDVADGDFVAWLDSRLALADRSVWNERNAQLRTALLHPLGQICGVSNKVASMVLSPLLLAGDRSRALWLEAGTVLIAVDTLVHNFLHRTGIIARLGVPHPYGHRCYRGGGCAEILDHIADHIDARRFKLRLPGDHRRSRFRDPR